jgi:hypothetical protein
MKLPYSFWFLLIVLNTSVVFSGQQERGELCRTIAQTPNDITASIVRTDFVMDGGSIVNDLRFSDGRRYALTLDYPINIANNKVLYPTIHFTVRASVDATRSETVEHGSAVELRMIALLETLMRNTSNPHEKKNASTLISCLKDRSQRFPRAHGERWDLSPW